MISKGNVRIDRVESDRTASIAIGAMHEHRSPIDPRVTGTGLPVAAAREGAIRKPPEIGVEVRVRGARGHPYRAQARFDKNSVTDTVIEIAISDSRSRAVWRRGQTPLVLGCSTEAGCPAGR